MNNDMALRGPPKSPALLVFEAARKAKRPPAPRREPPYRPKKPPIDEPPSRIPDRPDPQDPPPAGDPLPNRPPSKLMALPHALHEWAETFSVVAGEYTRAVL